MMNSLRSAITEGAAKPNVFAVKISSSKHESSHPGSFLWSLARHLDQQRQIIIKEWAEWASRDGLTLVPILTGTEICFHLARLFDDLIATLGCSEDETLARLVMEHVSGESTDCWNHDCALPDVLWEIAHLRTALQYRLLYFEEFNPDFSITARHFASATIDRFLDDLIIRATERFLRAHEICRPAKAHTQS